MLFVVIMLHLTVTVRANNCYTNNYLPLNYFNAFNDSSAIVGMTSACTIFIVPGPLVANSNFLDELKMIDLDRKKTCYGVSVHILESRRIIVLFLREARLAFVVHCVWIFSGKLFYCRPDYQQVLFVYKPQRACTNLIQFAKGFSLFCAVSETIFDKVTYLNNDQKTKHIKINSVSLFLKEYSVITFVANDISHAGFFEMNIFDDVYIEQLASNDIYENKIDPPIGLLKPRNYSVSVMEIHNINELGNISMLSDSRYYINLHQAAVTKEKWYCIARFNESDYLDAKRYKKRYLKKFIIKLYEKLTRPKRRMNIYEGIAEKCGTGRLHYILKAVILLTPVFSIILIATVLLCWYRRRSSRYTSRLFLG